MTNGRHITVIVLLLIGGIILTLGDIFMEKWVTAHSNVFYFAGLLIYLVGLIFLAQSYRFENIAVASTMIVIFNVITLAFVSWLYFNKALSPLQIFGVLLGFTSVIILAIA